MAQRRMISKSISTSTKLSEVSLFARLLFTWIIPHCDDYGRMEGSPRVLRAIVIPLFDETVAQVQTALSELENMGLLKTYDVGGRQYLQILRWDEHQTFRADRPRMSSYPNQSGVIEVDEDETRTPISSELRREVHRRDGKKCRYCGSENGPFHIDHVLPRNKGGRTQKGNLVVACESCNKKKHTSTLDELGWVLLPEPMVDKRQPVGVFRPSKGSEGKLSEVKIREELVGSLRYLSNVPAEDIAEFVKRFDITERKIRSVAEDLKLYCERKGKTYKNYKSFLLNAIKRDHRERPAPPPPKEPERPLTEAQKKKNAETLASIRDIASGKRMKP